MPRNTFIKSRHVILSFYLLQRIIRESIITQRPVSKEGVRVEIIAQVSEPDIPEIKVILSSHLIVSACFLKYIMGMIIPF